MDEFGNYVRIGKMLTLEPDDPRFVDLKKRFDEQVDADYESLLVKMKEIVGKKDWEE